MVLQPIARLPAAGAVDHIPQRVRLWVPAQGAHLLAAACVGGGVLRAAQGGWVGTGWGDVGAIDVVVLASVCVCVCVCVAGGDSPARIKQPLALR